MTPQELRALRQSLGLSQQGFADWLSVGKSTVYRWENGRRPVSEPWPDYIRLLLKDRPPVRKTA